MNEIKFRAWDKATRKVLEVIEIDFQGMEILVIDHDEQEAREAVHGHYELMQYTGLKDKNGVEIYEGDIIKYSNIYVSNYLWEVSHGRAELVLKNKSAIKPLNDVNSIYLKVIGNIYEDPELLKVTE